MAHDDQWVDREAGPVVRPYAVTGGRTEPADGELLDLVAVIVARKMRRSAVAKASGAAGFLSPEHRKILDLCQEPITVADIASETLLPLGVVRVLLADLTEQSRISVLPPRAADEQPSADLLKEVLHGLRAL